MLLKLHLRLMLPQGLWIGDPVPCVVVVVFVGVCAVLRQRDRTLDSFQRIFPERILWDERGAGRGNHKHNFHVPDNKLQSATTSRLGVHIGSSILTCNEVTHTFFPFFFLLGQGSRALVRQVRVEYNEY